MLVSSPSAPEARSAEGDEGGEAALVSSAADLYQAVTHFYGQSGLIKILG